MANQTIGPAIDALGASGDRVVEAAEPCRERGMSNASFYKWRAKA